MIVLVLSLIAMATQSQAAPRTRNNQAIPGARDNGASTEQQRCRDMVGKESTEGEGRAHIGQFQVQRFSDCMMGRPQM
jgi:hypothetical protein